MKLERMRKIASAVLVALSVALVVFGFMKKREVINPHAVGDDEFMPKVDDREVTYNSTFTGMVRTEFGLEYAIDPKKSKDTKQFCPT